MDIEAKADDIYMELMNDPDEVLRLLKGGLDTDDGEKLANEWIGFRGSATDVGAYLIYARLDLLITKQANIEAMAEAKRLAELEYIGSDLNG